MRTYLEEQGVDETELDELFARPEDEIEERLPEFMRRRGIYSPRKLGKYLRGSGVPRAEIEELYRAPAAEFPQRLRELRERHDIPSFRRAPRTWIDTGPARGNGPAGSSAPDEAAGTKSPNGAKSEARERPF